jgi:predicted RNA-binding Zn ribbon-like protein
MTLSAPATAEGAALTAPADDLCLQFANTLSWRGSAPPRESLHALDDVLAWAAAAGELGRAAALRLAAWWRRRPREAAAAFRAAIDLREAVFRIFGRSAAGGRPAPADLEALNAALARAPGRAQLLPLGRTYAWRVGGMKADMAALLAPVIWSAADLLAGPRLPRVRQCANERCLWLFLDDSKSANRRWCAMSACGNRAKAHRHYLKQKRA